jgi:hypothetical protein
MFSEKFRAVREEAGVKFSPKDRERISRWG